LSDATTSQRLLSAAEELFAQRGVEAVSLREIAREAGARNVVAVQYHFGDRDGLVQAILDRHRVAIEGERHLLLDGWEADPSVGIRGLAAALVRPYGAKLSDIDGGSEFLQIYADLLNRPDPLVEPGSLQDPGNSLFRWRRLVDPLLDDEGARLHRRFTVITLTITELGRRARAGASGDHRLFISTLIDHVAAILATETSDETRSLLAARDDGPPAAYHPA
jgi:AcrR family transcriptional regulator